MNQPFRQTRAKSILQCGRAVQVPDAELAARFRQKSVAAYSKTCSDLGARVWCNLDERALSEDFTVFVNMLALIARRPSTRSGLMVEIGALHRKGRPDTTKVEVTWAHAAVDPEDFEELEGTNSSIRSDKIAIELPLPPELARRLWARFALNMRYECESEPDLVVHIPYIKELTRSKN